MNSSSAVLNCGFQIRDSRNGRAVLFERYLASLADGLVHDDQISVVFAEKLLVGVEQFDAIDGAVRRDVYVYFVAEMKGFNLRSFLVQAQIGDVVARIIGELHTALSLRSILPEQ